MLTDLLGALVSGAPVALDPDDPAILQALAAEIAALPEKPRREAQAALEHQFRDQAAKSMVSYIDYMEMGFRPARHHRALIQALEAVERGEGDRLMVLMPPGSAKSTYTTGIFPSYYLGRNPRNSVIAASHTQELIERWGRRSRNMFASELHRNVFHIGVSPDSNAAGRWDTEAGGEYYATGVGGAVTGRRGDLGIIDDPVRSREDADSERTREKTWDWYISDFCTRLKPGAAQIVVMTRWHEDDLGGRILEMEGARWKVIKLPMEARPGDPLGRKPGERLWPEWFTEQMVADAKRDTRTWNALYQQEPVGEDGDYFKRDWFRDIDDRAPPGKLSIYGASDYAVTEGGGDYTEHGIFGVDAQSNLYLLDWWRGQTTSDVWIEAKCDLIIRHEPLCWFGEAGPIRRAVEPFLIRRMEERRAFCRLEWLPSVADKPTRCRTFQALAASGKVFVPRLAQWKSEVMGQLLRFPAGTHDDAVDVCSLIGRGLQMVRPPDMSDGFLPTYANIANERVKRFHRR